ncbi:globin [Rozella allomycis CSF55]|uniref:Globin n=1 Tax=Rozella allomycis (strain CSF55) TaxID=988480 RepID=A0A075AMS7_ROZAC|nr:Globin-like domain-containing protein [Rozella allomycis CSF55]RKP22184.1 globin [Rozella allomycis CSF55]|eukprot:EPZ31004.1 Globin-like domain-containing protein [Rozella allomycis CSF55]
MKDHDENLFEEIGGVVTISLVVDKFCSMLLKDKRINTYFKNVDVDRLKRMQTSFLCSVSGGPPYNGQSMRSAHKRLLDLKDKHFDAILENLDKAMEQATSKQISYEHRKKLLCLAEFARSDVLGK